jgi:hypothetical protein
MVKSTKSMSFHCVLAVAAIPAALAKKPGMPSFFQCAAFSAIFGGAGYVTNAGDSENGAGIATGMNTGT